MLLRGSFINTSSSNMVRPVRLQLNSGRPYIALLAFHECLLGWKVQYQTITTILICALDFTSTLMLWKKRMLVSFIGGDDFHLLLCSIRHLCKSVSFPIKVARDLWTTMREHKRSYGHHDELIDHLSVNTVDSRLFVAFSFSVCALVSLLEYPWHSHAVLEFLVTFHDSHYIYDRSLLSTLICRKGSYYPVTSLIIAGIFLIGAPSPLFSTRDVRSKSLRRSPVLVLVASILCSPHPMRYIGKTE